LFAVSKTVHLLIYIIANESQVICIYTFTKWDTLLNIKILYDFLTVNNIIVNSWTIARKVVNRYLVYYYQQNFFSRTFLTSAGCTTAVCKAVKNVRCLYIIAFVLAISIGFNA